MSEVELRAVGAIIEQAVHPEDIFGILAGDEKEKMAGLKSQHHRLLTAIHPDKYAGNRPVFAYANTVFVKATELLHRAEDKIHDGTYGDKTKVEPKRVDQDPPPKVVRVKETDYTLLKLFAQGDLADLYLCDYTIPAPPPPVVEPKKDPVETPKSVWERLVEYDGTAIPSITHSVFKVVRLRQDNDLLDNEAEVLKTLYPKDAKDEKYFRYLPKILDTLTFRSKVSGNRKVNLLTYYEGMYSLSDIYSAYPNGLDYRDVVWMYKRILEGLGYVHEQGFVHGNIILPHVLVHPVTHGARIIDWSYAVRNDRKSHVKAISKSYRGYYAPEVLAKKPATPVTDVYMATKCIITLLGGDATTGTIPTEVPTPIRSLLKMCIDERPGIRPTAWDLHERLTDILNNVVGKPKYRPLEIPPKASV